MGNKFTRKLKINSKSSDKQADKSEGQRSPESEGHGQVSNKDTKVNGGDGTDVDAGNKGPTPIVRVTVEECGPNELSDAEPEVTENEVKVTKEPEVKVTGNESAEKQEELKSTDEVYLMIVLGTS